MIDLRLPSSLTPPRTLQEAPQWARRSGLVIVAYYLAGRLGMALPEIAHGGWAVAPATGIALAALLRYGPGMWPALWIAALSLALTQGHGLPLAAVLAAANTLGPALADWALRRGGFRVTMDQRRDLWLYGSFGVLLAPAVSAVACTFGLALLGTVPATGAVYFCVGNAMGAAIGAAVTGPPLLVCTRQGLDHALGAGGVWQRVALCALVAAVAWGMFAPDGAPPGMQALLLVPSVLLMGWLAARSGHLAAAAVGAALAAVAVVATANGLGPLVRLEPQRSAVMLTAYVLLLMATPLWLAALLAEGHQGQAALRRLLDAADLGLARWNLQTGQVALSGRWLALLRLDAEPVVESIGAFWQRCHADDVAGLQRALEQLAAPPRPGDGEAGRRCECRLRCADGSWRRFELDLLAASRAGDGRALRILASARDLSERELAREREQVAESLYHLLHEGLLIIDAKHRVIDVNPKYSDITGYSREELLGSVPPLLGPALQGGLLAQGSWQGVWVDQRRDGMPCILDVSIAAVPGAGAAERRHVIAISDITLARQQLEQLERQAHFDELTRLPNRAKLAQMLQAALAASDSGGALLTVCYFDLDHFKPVNDAHGHDVGDRLLVELARRLRRSLRSWAAGDDVVARIGGDEFVLLLRTATLTESRHAVERVLREVSRPYLLGEGIAPVVVTASIGATVYPFDRADAETLLRHADHAMYGAKQAGRNGYLFFDAEHNRRAEARFVALGRVQEALDAGEFRLHFQPKVDMRRGTVLGAEALLRWQHPEEGLLPPSHFLPLIELTDLSVAVGNWVLERGIAQLAHWLHRGLDLTLSVNVSARHLQEPHFASHLAALLARHAHPVAEHLVIEVLETAALADIDYTCTLMQQCRAMGVRFALDDFGTGYSTLTYLKRLPLDMLKIDRSFVMNMLNDRQDLAIVEGVIGLSQTFACSVVAEGVETVEQARLLIDIGCEVGQGHGIAAAMPAVEVEGWVRAYAGMPAARPALGVAAPG